MFRVTSRAMSIAPMREAELQEQVIQLARIMGWLVHHDRRQDQGIGGDAGFPDLVLARGGRVIFAELKTEKATPTENQERWLAALDPAQVDPGAPTTHERYVWRPSDFDQIKKILSQRR